MPGRPLEVVLPGAGLPGTGRRVCAWAPVAAASSNKLSAKEYENGFMKGSEISQKYAVHSVANKPARFETPTRSVKY
jgi:hypothetical protein